MDWSPPRRPVRAHLLSQRGVAAIYALAVAVTLLAILLSAFALARRPAVVMRPIACPAEWQARGATCWKAYAAP